MRTTVISICEQTHPECRGHACDDHIYEYCHAVILTPELEDKILQEIQRIEKEAEKARDQAVEIWEENHPGEECRYEGEEFVGLIWVEITGITDTSDPASHYRSYGGGTTSSDMLEILQNIKPLEH